jgi:hypothetical protein
MDGTTDGTQTRRQGQVSFTVPARTITTASIADTIREVTDIYGSDVMGSIVDSLDEASEDLGFVREMLEEVASSAGNALRDLDALMLFEDADGVDKG